MFVIIRKLITILIASFNRTFNRFPDVTVLCYHSIANIEWPFNTSPERFKKQIEKLLEMHIFITSSQFEKYMLGSVVFKKPAILLTFDDGYKSILNIKKFLEIQRIKPILFFESDPDNIIRDEIENELPLLSKTEVNSLLADGWSLGSHGATHYNLLEANDTILLTEINKSKKILEEVFKKDVNFFAYSKGSSNYKIEREAKNADYTLAFKMDGSFITKQTNPFTLPRIGVMSSHDIFEFISMQTRTVLRVKKIIRSILKMS